jgi:AcrR family transcriptional regulator
MTTPPEAPPSTTDRPPGPSRPEATPPRDRLSRSQRRDHLLDVTATLVLAGETPISMESLARAAGVSKTLPYKHFDNVAAVLDALFRRETMRLAAMVGESLQAAGPGDDLARVWINAYFDALASHGAVVRKLHTPGSDSAGLTDPASSAVAAVGLVLREVLGVDPGRAAEMSRTVHGAIVGAAVSWVNGEAARDDLQDLLIALLQIVRKGPGR